MENLQEKVYCSHCKGERFHNILETHETKSDILDDFQWNDKYHIVQCNGCGTIAFVRQYGDENQIDHDQFGHAFWYDEFTVYPEEPKSNEGIIKAIFPLKVKRFKNLPETLFHLYNQIVGSYNLGYRILSLSGIRTLIEGICKELNIDGGYLYNPKGERILNKKEKEIYSNNIQGMIYGLYEQSQITFHHALILQKIREKSNDTIHDVIVPEEEDLRDIIAIVEHLIQNAFELKNHRLLRD